MCGSCDNDDMGEITEIFGSLYKLGYKVSYEKTFNDILKHLRHDACSTPNLRKYSIKLDEFTQDWMQQMSGNDIMEQRRPHDDPPPYDIDNMTWEQFQEAVGKQEIEDQKKRDDAEKVAPLFSSYVIHKRKPSNTYAEKFYQIKNRIRNNKQLSYKFCF